MSSLAQLLEQHESALIIDAASGVVQTGWLHRDGAPRWAKSSEEAGIGVFRSIEQLGVGVRTAGAFLFCDGPGSILGIRTVAMALRTWRVLDRVPAYSYCSLELVAGALNRQGTGIIADARRQLWHCIELGGTLRRVSAEELPEKRVMPEGFRHWSPLPSGVEMVPYDVAQLLEQTKTADLFRPSNEPDAFLHEEPRYVTWTPQIHRAPLSS